MTEIKALVVAAMGSAFAYYMNKMSEADILARTIWAEARGEGEVGMAAVAQVIMNRVADPRWANTVRGVVLQDRQFSGWNADDPSGNAELRVTLENQQFAQAHQIALAAINGTLPDIVGPANHYFNPSVVLPGWSRQMREVATIGGHRFYVG